MKNTIQTLLFITLISIANYNGLAQGCSDAGFCTAGGIKPMGNGKDQMANSLGFTMGYGIGEQNTHVLTAQFEPQIKVSPKSMVQIKLPFVFIKGTLGTANGLGDALITYNHLFDSTWKKPITLTVGSRIATGTAAGKIDEISVPMPYQVSLGTTDFILGLKIDLGNGYSISAGWQQPVFNRNQNGFDSVAYKVLRSKHTLEDEDNYFISANLKRKGDVLLRIDKSFNWEKASVGVGLLPIYHLGKDKVSLSKNREVELENSQGLTLNINLRYSYKVTDLLELYGVMASPLIVRESRPDGLTRALVVLAGLRYNL